jgi:hypothetical protein
VQFYCSKERELHSQNCMGFTCSLVARAWKIIRHCAPELVVVGGIAGDGKGAGPVLRTEILSALVNGRTLQFFIWLNAHSSFQSTPNCWAI